MDPDQGTYHKALNHRKCDWNEETYRAISFLFLNPLRPFVVLGVMRSILLMMLIHGISKFTIADMADSTPLKSCFR